MSSCAREPAIAILERVNLQERGGEYRNGKKRMKVVFIQCRARPFDKLGDPSRCIKGRCIFEDHANLLAVGIESRDIAGIDLAYTSVPCVFVAVNQQVAVELPGMIFGDCQFIGVGKHGFHGFRISGDFLLIARLEFSDFEIH